MCFIAHPVFCVMAIFEQKICIKQWAEADRPREKLVSHGRRHLSDAELLAILIGSGNPDETSVDLSKRVLAANNNDLNTLSKASIAELSSFRGIGQVKAINILAALELGRRRAQMAEEKLVKISCSEDSYHLLAPVLADLNHEEFWMLLLNRANCVIGRHQVSVGGVAGTIADPKVLFKLALEKNASYIILAHNHPSGNLTPSKEDIQLTNKIAKAGMLLDLIVLDHLIVTNKSFFSFNEEGLI